LILKCQKKNGEEENETEASNMLKILRRGERGSLNLKKKWGWVTMRVREKLWYNPDD
jgi:hypothetical protein